MVTSLPSEDLFDEPATQSLDLRGLNCPLPVLRTAKMLRKSPPGTLLKIECTDPLAAIDIPHFIAGTAHIVQRQIWRENVLIFYIKRV
jgi:tRNA 2-thiouridine synthesizing protein A